MSFSRINQKKDWKWWKTNENISLSHISGRNHRANNSSWWLQMIISNLSQHSCISLKLKFVIFFSPFAMVFLLLVWWCNCCCHFQTICSGSYWMHKKTSTHITEMRSTSCHLLCTQTVLLTIPKWNVEEISFYLPFFGGQFPCIFLGSFDWIAHSSMQLIWCTRHVVIASARLFFSLLMTG